MRKNYITISYSNKIYQINFSFTNGKINTLKKINAQPHDILFSENSEGNRENGRKITRLAIKKTERVKEFDSLVAASLGGNPQGIYSR